MPPPILLKSLTVQLQAELSKVDPVLRNLKQQRPTPTTLWRRWITRETLSSLRQDGVECG
jgi:hypothetical protein